MVAEQGLVQRDTWSFASANPWLMHEWLSELFMHFVHATAGFGGVALLRGLMVGVVAAILIKTCRGVAGPDVAATVGVIAMVAVFPSAAERPQLVSWALLAAVCPWLRRRIAERRAPWALTALTWLWANLHGLWLMVIVLYGALVLGLAIEVGLRRWRELTNFALVGLGATCATMLTPVGPPLLAAPFHVREYARFVTEWATPNITSPTTACAVLLLAVVVVDWARSSTPVDPPTIAFVAAATVLGLTYTRTVPVLAIAVAPLAAAAVQRWTDRPVPCFRLERAGRIQWAVAALCVVPLAAVMVTNATTIDPIKAMSEPSERRALAVARELDALPGRARVLNEYDLGGWLIWAARDTSPGIDGRAEIYPVEYVEHYIGALGMAPGWQEFVDRSDADAAVLYRKTPLAAGLVSIGWRTTSDDGGVLVLLPPASGPSDRENGPESGKGLHPNG